MGGERKEIRKFNVWDDGAKRLSLPRRDGTPSIVHVRRITPTVSAKLGQAAGVIYGGAGDAGVLMMVKVRWAITLHEQLRDAETLQDVPASVPAIDREYAAAGKIAHERVYDALSTIDVQAVLALAEGNVLLEDVQREIDEHAAKVEASAAEMRDALRKAESAQNESDEKNSGASPRPSGGGDATSAIGSAEPTAA